MNEFFSNELGAIAGVPITIQRIGAMILVAILLVVLWRVVYRWFISYSKSHRFTEVDYRKISFYGSIIWVLLYIEILIWLFGVSIVIAAFDEFKIRLSALLYLLTVVVGARIFELIVSSRIVEEFQPRSPKEEEKSEDERGRAAKKVTRDLDYFIMGFVSLLGLQIFELDRSIHLVSVKGVDIDLYISNIITVVLIILAARILRWVIVNFVLYNLYRRNRIDTGKQYSYNTLLGYVVYFVATILSLQSLGINMTILWGGAAALLVGIGFALQQVISDFFSGLVLLFERSIEVGDFVVVGSVSGTIKKIGIRASVIETLERKVMVIPNSRLVNDAVINWNNTRQIARFDVEVGVAYGSDIELVRRLLLEAVKGQMYVADQPQPFVRLLNFGDSSLDFAVFFFSGYYLKIEEIKSSIRVKIAELFTEHNVTIPFPQRDVWFKSNEGAAHADNNK